MSCLHSWQADEGIIAHCGQSFQCYVAGSLDNPFVVLLKQDGTYEAYDGGLVGEYSDYVCPAFDLAVRRSSGLVLCSFIRCCVGKLM